MYLPRKYLNALCILFIPITVSFAGASIEPQKALFAGGCFWCIEAAFEDVKGVEDAVSGYAGGHIPNPTYEEVSQGSTGHYETVEVTYNPVVVSYKELLDIFWRNIDPLDEYGQFVDRGNQYKTAIFYFNDEQKQEAENSKRSAEEKFGQPVQTRILPATIFYKAEEYHQDYFRKNPFGYKRYKAGSGRSKRLETLWGEEANNH